MAVIYITDRPGLSLEKFIKLILAVCIFFIFPSTAELSRQNVVVKMGGGDRSSINVKHSAARKDNIPGEVCSKRDIAIRETYIYSLSRGISVFKVEIMNRCMSGCAISNIHISCGPFASAVPINPRIFRRLAFDDCLLEDGKKLRAGGTVSFSDRILLQQDGLGIDVFDASSETAQPIKSTELNAVQKPYYLEKLDMFLVYTRDRKVHVCDPQGSVKVRFDVYQMCLGHNFKYSCLNRTDSIPGGFFITDGQHIAISVCFSNHNRRDEWMIDYDDDTEDDDDDDEDHRMINVSN